MLLQAGARLDMLDKKKNTAIHYAAIYGHYQSIEFLRQNGADINAQNSLGFTPIMGKDPQKFRNQQKPIKPLKNPHKTQNLKKNLPKPKTF